MSVAFFIPERIWNYVSYKMEPVEFILSWISHFDMGPKSFFEYSAESQCLLGEFIFEFIFLENTSFFFFFF